MSVARPAIQRPWCKLLWRASAALCLSVAVLGGATLVWLLASESGGACLVRQLPWMTRGQLSASGWHGRLLGAWQIERLRFTQPDTDIEIRGLAVVWQPQALFHRQLVVERMTAADLIVRTAASDTPARLPSQLALPLDAQVQALRIDTLQVGSLPQAGRPAQAAQVFRHLTLRWQATANRHDIPAWAVDTPWGAVHGDLSLASQPPFALQGHARFTGLLDGHPVQLAVTTQGPLAAPQLQVALQGQGVSGDGTLALQPFAPLPLQRARLALHGLDPASFAPGVPHALLDIAADLQPSALGRAGQAPDWQVSGPVQITNRQPGTLEAQRIPLTQLGAQINWGAGRLQLRQLQGALSGDGRLSGEATWLQGRGQDRIGQLEAALRVSNIDPARISQRARSDRVQGSFKASAKATEQTLSGTLSAQRYQADLAARLAGQVLTVARATLRAEHAQADLSGQLALSGAQAFSFSGRVDHLNPRVFLADVPVGDLNAEFSATGNLVPTWQSHVKLLMGASQWAGYPLDGRLEATLSAQRIRAADVNLGVMGNRLIVSGGLPEETLQVSVDAPHLERFGHELGGTLRVDGQITGSWQDPAGSLQVQGEKLHLPGDLLLASLALKAEVAGGAQGNVALAATLKGLSSPGKEGPVTYVQQLDLLGQGSRRDHTLSVQGKGYGDERVDLQVHGGLDARAWAGQLRRLSLAGPLSFALAQPAELTLSPSRVLLGEAVLSGETGRIDLLRTEWTPERVIARGKISGVQLGVSLDEYQRTVFKGRSLQLGGQWDVTLAERPQGLIKVFREGGDFVLQGDAPVALGLENFEANLAAQDGQVVLSALANGSRIGALNAAATLATRGQGANTRIDMAAPLVAVLSANVPSISWVGPLADQNLRTGGSLSAQFNITGTPERPVSTGFIHGEQLTLGLAEQGLRLADGRLTLNFDADRVRLEQLVFRADNRMAPPDGRLPRLSGAGMSGALTGTGAVELATGKGHFTLNADKVAALQQPNQWMLLSGEAQVDSGWDRIDINAKVRADAGFIGVPRNGAPTLAEDVTVRGRKKPAQRVRVNADVRFDFGERFILKAYGIDTWLDGQLRIRLAQGEVPRANGSVLARNGVFDAYGQKLEIERGAVNFQGALDNPGLNVVALRKGLEVEAGVQVSGTAQRPSVRLISEPNVPEQEKLSWILFGRPSEGSAADIGVLVSAAGSTLGGEGGEGLATRIANGFGLDSLSIGSSTSGSTRNLQSSVVSNATGTHTNSSQAASQMGAQVLNVGKRLSTRTYLSFEQNFLGTESVVKLSYMLTRLVSVIAHAGTDNGLELNYSVSFK